MFKLCKLELVLIDAMFMECISMAKIEIWMQVIKPPGYKLQKIHQINT